MTDINRVWRLIKRPVGDIADGDLVLSEESVPTIADGEFLVRTHYLSLDPTNRIWMSDMDQYMPPVALGDVMRGIVCGTVVESKNPKIKQGTAVSGLGGWADFQVGTAQTMAPMGDLNGISMAEAFGVFAVVGPTAYFCLLDVGQPKAGETVVVSAAAGAVGSIVGQIAKIKGCRAVGIAGSDEKCSWITSELGFDTAINYKTDDLAAKLKAACPDGIDVYFDNTGGPILDTVLPQMNLNGRIPTCGLIANYNASEPVPGPYNYDRILMQRLRIEGFILTDFMHRGPEAIAALSGWMREGKLKFRLDMSDGLETAVDSVRKLYSGANTGKLMVQVSSAA